LAGKGCPKCKNETLSKKFLSNINDFVKKSTSIHGNKYDYSKFIYKNSSTKGIVTCPIHSDFLIHPNNHLNGKECPKCNGGVKYTNIEFIIKSNKTHNNFYNYSKCNYINSKTKITVTCPIHGDYLQAPSHHLVGNGCPKCKMGISKQQTDFLNFIDIKIQNVALKEWKRKKVDGFDPKTNTVYEFLGDYYHGNPIKYSHDAYNPTCHKTFGELYNNTFKSFDKLKKLGYNLKYIWENDWLKFKNNIVDSPNILTF
jgi:hypothetical protein